MIFSNKRRQDKTTELHKKKIRQNKNLLYGLLFVSPAILGYIIFIIAPMVFSLVMSFTNYSMFSKPDFIGLNNYINLFTGNDQFFYLSLKATGYFVVLGVPATITFSYILAILLSRDIKFKSIFRTILYLPSITPVVASSFVWLWLLNPDLGLVNMILKKLGLPTSLWFFSETTAVPSIVLTCLWGVGGTMIIFIAAIEAIPEQYYEAAAIEGGNIIHKTIHITLPLTTPTIFFSTVMAIIGFFQIFTQAFILTGGGPNNATLFYVYNLWREAFVHSRMGVASAEAWILFIIILFFTLFVFRTQSSWVYYEDVGSK